MKPCILYQKCTTEKSMWVMKCGLCPITSLLIEFQPLCQDLCKILISRIMEELGLKMGQDLSL